MHLRKDQSLDALAAIGNVAQFVAFEPRQGAPYQTFLRILGEEPNCRFSDPAAAIEALLARAADGTVNIRSYTPDSPRSREFVYAVADTKAALGHVERLTAQGLSTIVNETIDVADGGVSGVLQGDVIEFAPDDTPRCVEKPGVASLPADLGVALLGTVYGFAPDFAGLGGRVEFSIHPRPRGWRGGHTLLWEQEDLADPVSCPALEWPNRFSRHLGDKLYGLLMAHLAGLPVPVTRAVPRRVAPFAFGLETGSHETWIRTCPREQQPGLFTTHRGWLDPFRLLAQEDPAGNHISSVLAQAGVRARYAGASLVDARGTTIVEGIKGFGDGFMLGEQRPEPLPDLVVADVMAAGARLTQLFGPVRTEWVHDGERVWIVQLHRGATTSTERVLVPGDRAQWVAFKVEQGLEALRSLLASVEADAGVEIMGSIGMTSHMADLVRKAGVPTRVVPA